MLGLREKRAGRGEAGRLDDSIGYVRGPADRRSRMDVWLYDTPRTNCYGKDRDKEGQESARTELWLRPRISSRCRYGCASATVYTNDFRRTADSFQQYFEGAFMLASTRYPTNPSASVKRQFRHVCANRVCYDHVTSVQRTCNNWMEER